MVDSLLSVSIVDGPVLAVLYGMAGFVILWLFVGLARGHSRMVLMAALVTVLSGALGYVLCSLASDVWDLFGVSLSVATRLWAAAGFAGIGLAVFVLVIGHWRMRILAVVAIPLVLITAAAGVNVDFGQFPTLRTALGLPEYQSLESVLAGSGTGFGITQTTDVTKGVVGTVTIPATVSGFKARDALVYLPPVARLPNPVRLPVVMMMSGQPGSPADVFTAGHLETILDSFAAAHSGQAPIVVVPDQLGTPGNNPMCVDSPLGNSATYLTVDVPNWIRANLPVGADPVDWTIAGFSQGGTCSIQLGAAHPELFGNILDISGELVPQNGDTEQTIAAGFGGDAAAYAAAAPTVILAAHAPYSNLLALFAVGADDSRYVPWTREVAAAARAAGATTDVFESPGTAHDWHTVQYAWTKALPLIAARGGVGEAK
ncbi:alpha/beta hydrolase [Leifsonia sp. A12D58]|uniref:alpha/beta hydrolase n=1 Tax=Leifsonia sp. A12D58 TaxID=3397674 RepID=UPI0039E000F4